MADVEPESNPRRSGAAKPGRRKSVLIIGGVVIAVVIAAAAIGAALPQATNLSAYSALIGKQAPSFSGTTLLGSKSVALSDFRGRYVVVNFFASWCSPCEEEAPYLEQFSYNDAKVAALIGIEFEDVNSTASQFLVQTGATFPAISDPGEKIAMAYGVKGPPETYVISPSGVVVAHIAGPLTDKDLESVIAKARSKHY